MVALCGLGASSACGSRGPQALTPAELPAAAAPDWLPAELPIRLRVDLGAIRDSVWGPPLWTGIQEGLAGRMEEHYEAALALLEQVDVAYMAGSLDEQDSRGVLVLEGADALTADLPSLLGSEPGVRHGWETYALSELIAFSPSPGVLVVTSAEYLQAVSVHPSKRLPSLRASSELPEATLALVVHIDEPTRRGMRGQTGESGMIAELVAPMIEELDSVSFTADLQDGGLQLHGRVDFSGERGAQLTGALLGYLGGAAQNAPGPQAGGQTAASLLLNQLNTRVEGTSVHIDLSLDAVQLGQLMSATAAEEAEPPAPLVPGSTL